MAHPDSPVAVSGSSRSLARRTLLGAGTSSWSCFNGACSKPGGCDTAVMPGRGVSAIHPRTGSALGVARSRPDGRANQAMHKNADWSFACLCQRFTFPSYRQGRKGRIRNLCLLFRLASERVTPGQGTARCDPARSIPRDPSAVRPDRQSSTPSEGMLSDPVERTGILPLHPDPLPRVHVRTACLESGFEPR